MSIMSVSEALGVAETIEIEVEHGYKPNRQQQALIALFKQVKKDIADKSRS
jgi:hypothetical protein